VSNAKEGEDCRNGNEMWNEDVSEAYRSEVGMRNAEVGASQGNRNGMRNAEMGEACRGETEQERSAGYAQAGRVSGSRRIKDRLYNLDGQAPLQRREKRSG
jgi:hypothetical protein